MAAVHLRIPKLRRQVSIVAHRGLPQQAPLPPQPQSSNTPQPTAHPTSTYTNTNNVKLATRTIHVSLSIDAAHSLHSQHAHAPQRKSSSKRTWTELCEMLRETVNPSPNTPTAKRASTQIKNSEAMAAVGGGTAGNYRCAFAVTPSVSTVTSKPTRDEPTTRQNMHSRHQAQVPVECG